MPSPDAVRSTLIAAAREFNAGRYFEAHEALEDGLEVVPDRLWELMLGLIQVAVGYHKLTQQLWIGGRRMLERGLLKLAPFGDGDSQVKLTALRQRVEADIEALKIGRFDVERFRRHPPRLQLSNR